jgi:hypothetical protein
MIRSLLVLLFCLSTWQTAIGQASQPPITNSDLVDMVKSGIGDQTIILAIKQSPTLFDTSPQALILLKKAGTSDQVLNAVLTATKKSARTQQNTQPVDSQTQRTSTQPSEEPATTQTQGNRPQRDMQSGGEQVQGAPTQPVKQSAYAEALSLAEAFTKPDTQDMIKAVWLYARAWNFAPESSKDQVETKLEYYFSKYHGSLDGLSIIKAGAKDSMFPPEGYRFSTVSTSSAIASSSHSAGGGQSLSLRVLQSEQVPYTQESGGGISTSCNIVGSAQTSAFANAYGNSAYGNATTTSRQRMSCNSYDTTVRWSHVLVVMFAEGSDGVSYMFGCDRAWRWSKCQPLQAGDTFSAQFTDKGLQVEAESSSGKEVYLNYHVLQSRVTQ